MVLGLTVFMQQAS